MPSRERCLASLRELQLSFAAALHDPARACAVTPAANLQIYRDNSAANFKSALAGSFPVLRRRVGADYFRQLAREYRAHAPSRSGDLHWAGREFAAFLAAHLHGSDYEWLADLARLEWAREQSAVDVELPAIAADALGAHAPEMLEHLRFQLQPSLRLLESPFPVFSVWLANKAENAPPVDQSLGGEQGLTRIHGEWVEVQKLPPDLFSFICALSAGSTLGEALTAAGVEGPRLTELLGFVFGSDLVVALRASGAPPA